MQAISKYLLTGNNLAYITSYFALICIAIYIIYLIIVRNFFPKNYHGTRFTTKNITYIAMMTAVAATVTIAISMTVPITVLPPIRVAFEGIMIKLSGMFFGPMAGIIVGLSTEALTILFVPSYLHVAYLLTAIIFGFLGGLTSFAQQFTGKKNWITFGIINAFVILYGVVMFFITSSYDGLVKVFGFEVPTKYFWIFFIASIGLTLLMVWITTFAGMFAKKMEFIETVMPIMLLAIVAEYMCTSLIASWGNANLLGTPKQGGYSTLLITALIIAPLKVASNTIILSTVYYVMKPLVLLKKDSY